MVQKPQLHREGLLTPTLAASGVAEVLSVLHVVMDLWFWLLWS